ncbi:MAG: trimethylamine methyltransferase family protein [Anaerolineales bacterium]
MSASEDKSPGAKPDKGLAGGQYRPLSEDQIHQIHEASLEILARTGVEVPSPEVREILQHDGAAIDGSRVRLRKGQVERAIERAPKRVLLAGRDPDNDLILEDKRVYIGTGGAALQVLDHDSDEIRPASLRDVVETARLVDALGNIHFFLIPVYPMNVPDERVEIHKYYAAIANTTKHVQGGVYTVKGIRDVVSMCERIMGGAQALRERPIVSFITSWMLSPLKFSPSVTELLMEVCRLRIPVVLSSAPMAGATAPATLAGMLAQVTAEQLAGLTLTQLVSEGCPVLIGPIPATLDMRTGKYLGGAVELGMCNAAVAQIAQNYGLPLYNSAGMTDAKWPDIQAGMEKAQSVIQVALAGANFIHHAAGMLEDMSTIAFEQFVFDNELLGMAMRAVRGIEVDQDTLALDAIDRVGPGGDFLSDDHTLLHLRTELYYPSPVFDRQHREHSEQDKWTDARSRARFVVRRILEEHVVQELEPAVDAWIHERFELDEHLLEA